MAAESPLTTTTPYGAAIQASGQISSNFRCAGMFYHQDSGLYLTHYRAYDPQTGRWLSRDPVGELDVNLYTYADGNPISRVDPTGLWCFFGRFANEIEENRFDPIATAAHLQEHLRLEACPKCRLNSRDWAWRKTS
jgi:RHS repeat-associated protein